MGESMSEATQPVFTERDQLHFHGICLGADYSLPFFLHESFGVPLFMDIHGNYISFCVDEEYEASDHCLLWLQYQGCNASHEYGCATIRALFTFGGIGARDVWRACGGPDWSKSPCIPKPPEQVLLMADHFDAGPLGELPTGWRLHAGSTTAVRLIPSSLTSGNAVQLNASVAGQSGVTIARGIPSSFSRPRDRLHLRARFQDNGSMRVAQCHWIGLTTRLGTGAVGVVPESPGHYAFVSGHWDQEGDGNMKYASWQRTSVKRRSGWHVFELVLEDGHLAVSIDGEPLSIKLATPTFDNDECVWLSSERGACGNWDSVELMHTPFGRATWETGVQSVVPPDVWPWKVHSQEKGRWFLGDGGLLEEIPVENLEKAVVQTEERDDFEDVVEEVVDDDEPIGQAEDAKNGDSNVQQMVGEPELHQESGCVESSEISPPPPPRPQSKSRKRRGRLQKTPDSSNTALSIECWALPSESELDRLDRVAGVLLEGLRTAGVTVPDNFKRLEVCKEPQHGNCYTYSFGTRRLHITTREAVGGRLTLVVRCGGGFLDFVEFVRRNGSLENLRLQRLLDGDGERPHLRLTSVFAQGRLNVSVA